MTVLVPALEGLAIHSVIDRGVPNKERIAIHATEDVSLAGVCTAIGIAQPDGTATPTKDNFLWFGSGFMKSGDWLFLYTGPGTPSLVALDQGASLISVYWGKKQTVLYSPLLVPMLFRIGAIALPPVAEPLPQYGQDLETPKLGTS